MKNSLFALTVLACLSGAPARAAFDLQITEIWMGNAPGNNLSEDWFELTNVGTTPWTTADGALFFDDDSIAPAEADLMSGITNIAPGESVIFVDGAAAGAAAFTALWSPVVSLWQVGSYEGAGLGQGGDGVSVFVTTGAAPLLDLSNVVIVEFESYPNANAFGGRSYDVSLAGFSSVGNSNGAVATLAVNTSNQPAIGSPGVAIPEPSCLAVALVAGAMVVGFRRR